MALFPDTWMATAACAAVLIVFVVLAASMLANQRWAQTLPFLDPLVRAIA